MKLSISTALILAAFITSPAFASSDASWAALDKASAKACITATGFKNAKVSAPTRFSDTLGYDARIVTGTYPQAHMKNAPGKMLCLYARKSKSAEVQELAK